MIKKILIVAAVAILAAAGYFIISASTSGKSIGSPKAANGNYIAFGDSVAAGVGLNDYSDSSACDRTKQAYPNIIANKLGFALQNQACSGASTQAGLVNSQNVNNSLLPPQINSIDVDTKPRLLTVTIGANDANWTDFIQKCYTQNCGSSSDTLAITVKLATAASNLDAALARVAARYPDATPTTAITGYYKLFSGKISPSCAELTGIDKNELTWIKQLQGDVDSMLKTVSAKYNFASYVPIDFTNHELCSQDSGIQGINDKAPFHPTQKGQEEIAKQVISVLKTKGYKE